jgi:hypothetical protein
MLRLERHAYQASQLKPHEGKMQELRHERKTEGKRLDGLKKALETKLSAGPAGANEGRAA